MFCLPEQQHTYHACYTSHFKAVMQGVFFHVCSKVTMVQLCVDLEKRASRSEDSQTLPVALSPTLARIGYSPFFFHLVGYHC